MTTRLIENLSKDSSNFSFRPLSQEDTEYYLKWFTSEKVRKNLSPSTPRTTETISDWVHRMTNQGDMKYYIIRQGDKAIGHAGIKNIDPQTRSAELSCVIGDEDSLGTGAGLTAMTKFFDFVFTNFDFDSIYLLRKKGVAGEKFFTSLGFITSQDSEMDRYTLTRPQYDQLRQSFAN